MYPLTKYDGMWRFGLIARYGFLCWIYFVDDTGACNLTETITFLSHLYKDYRPGENVIIDLDTLPVGFGVKQGCRIRVDISSDGGMHVPMPIKRAIGQPLHKPRSHATLRSWKKPSSNWFGTNRTEKNAAILAMGL